MRRWRVALAAGLLAAGLPAIAQALVVYSPLVVAVGDVTNYTFTFTNSDPTDTTGIRCAEVLFPDEFYISNLGTPTASNGRPWTSSQLGQWVLVYSGGGGGRLRVGQSVTFTVTALATAQGTFTFDNHVHLTSGCDDANINGTPLPFTVLPNIIPTPTPTPAPTASPKPTPAPTATPAATPPPSPRHTPDPGPHKTPDPATPTPVPTETPSLRPTATARPSVPEPEPSPSSNPPAMQVAPLSDGGDGPTNDLGVGVDVLTLLDSPFDWVVPGAAVGVPGLLVVLFVGLQAAGALAWIPAVRRMGEGDDRRRRGRPFSRSG